MIRRMLQLAQKVEDVVSGALANLWLVALGAEKGSGLRCFGIPIITMAPGSKIVLGENVVLCSRSARTALGVNHRVILRTLLPSASIVIGNNVGISGGSICAASSITIGNNCLIGANVTMTDTDFHPVSPLGRRYAPLLEAQRRPLIVEDNVFLGANVTVLKGVRIGRNSVIGAGSVVITDVPEGVIAAGNPCRVIRSISR